MNEPKLRFPEFKDLWNNHKIEDMFDRVGTPVDLDDTHTYREIGIRSHGKGIFHKDETTASEIGNKRVFWVEPNCFVVNIVFAWERAVAKTTDAESGMIVSHRFPMYKPKKDVVDLDYITEYFITKRGQNVLILASPGGAGRNKTLGQKEFAKSVVKLPSLPEQQKIAEFLSTIDTVIEKQKATVEAWEERKKGVMQKLFSQEVRFKADDGSEFPEWEEKKLGDISERILVGLATTVTPYYREKGRPMFRNLNIKQGYLDDRDMLFLDDDYADSQKNKAIHFGDILTVHTGNIGWSCLVPEKYEGALSFTTLITTVKFNVVSNKYVCDFLNSPLGMNRMQNLAFSGGRANLNTSEFQKVQVPVPCLAEQQKIADCLSSLDEVIEKQKATLAAWEEMKKGLLQQMFV